MRFNRLDNAVPNRLLDHQAQDDARVEKLRSAITELGNFAVNELGMYISKLPPEAEINELGDDRFIELLAARLKEKIKKIRLMKDESRKSNI